MRCYFLITLALLASTALGAALAACSPSLPVPHSLPPSAFILHTSAFRNPRTRPTRRSPRPLGRQRRLANV